MLKHPVATITFEDGRTMELELYPEVAPNTVNNFIELANSGYYDGFTIHRVVENFIIQGGSATGDCHQTTPFSIRGEFAENGHSNALKHEPGVLSMARGPKLDSAATQFFIMHKAAERLDGKYAAFGKLTCGYELLEEIAATPTDTTPGKDNPPLTPIVTKRIRVELGDWRYSEPERIIPAVPAT